MINTIPQIVKSLVDKGFTEEDATLMADNVQNLYMICYKIANEKSKCNTLLGLFLWQDSKEGTTFWKAKFRELEKEELNMEKQGDRNHKVLKKQPGSLES